MTDEHAIGTPQEWLTARLALLDREKELNRLRDEVAEQRRQLPWVPVTRQYAFDGPDGRVGLADLFGGCSQLIVYHFMYAFPWYSSEPGDFNVDYHVSFDPGQQGAEYNFTAMAGAPDKLPG